MLEQFGIRDAFDIFGRSTERKQLTLATDAESAECLALPTQGVPPGFSGAVGNFTMSASVGPTNVAVGDPITVRVRISGRGALEALNLPEQPKWREFKTYPPTSNVETTDKLGLEGAKTFEQVLVPQNMDIKELPEILFSYFDPVKKSYQTLSHPRTALTVRPAGAEPQPTVAVAARSSGDSEPAARDIVPIKRRTGTVAQVSTPLFGTRWFLLLQIIPVAAWLTASAWRKHADNIARNPRLVRKRQVAQLTRKELAALRRLAAANQSDEFFSRTFHLLQEQIGERLDLPASAITEAVVDERLRPLNAPETLLTGLHQLFQACNLARYAPIKSSEELASMIPLMERVIAELQAVKTGT
jgi:hypothetical protein